MNTLVGPLSKADHFKQLARHGAFDLDINISEYDDFLHSIFCDLYVYDIDQDPDADSRQKIATAQFFRVNRSAATDSEISMLDIAEAGDGYSEDLGIFGFILAAFTQDASSSFCDFVSQERFYPRFWKLSPYERKIIQYYADTVCFASSVNYLASFEVKEEYRNSGFGIKCIRHIVRQSGFYGEPLFLMPAKSECRANTVRLRNFWRQLPGKGRRGFRAKPLTNRSFAWQRKMRYLPCINMMFTPNCSF